MDSRILDGFRERIVNALTDAELTSIRTELIDEQWDGSNEAEQLLELIRIKREGFGKHVPVRRKQ